MSDYKSIFLEEMRKSGLEPDCEIIADGRLHRFRDWLDRPGSKNGWYVLHPDFPPAGAFGCWKRGIDERWCGLSKNGARLKGPHVHIEKSLVDNHRKGRELAEFLWERAIPANGLHGYLRAKRVKSHSTRYWRGALLIPVRDIAGNLHGLQQIYPNREKRFTNKTNKRGHFFMIGNQEDGPIGIAEGFATAATIHELTNLTMVVAFDAGNLLPVAETLRRAYPKRKIIICADNDRDHEGNPGLTKGKSAACSVDASLVYPQFTDFTSRGSDFNDLYLEEGAEAVKAQVLKKGADNVPVAWGSTLNLRTLQKSL